MYCARHDMTPAIVAATTPIASVAIGWTFRRSSRSGVKNSAE